MSYPAVDNGLPRTLTLSTMYKHGPGHVRQWSLVGQPMVVHGIPRLGMAGTLGGRGCHYLRDMSPIAGVMVGVFALKPVVAPCTLIC